MMTTRRLLFLQGIDIILYLLCKCMDSMEEDVLIVANKSMYIANKSMNTAMRRYQICN